jgi:hypothetical protein
VFGAPRLNLLSCAGSLPACSARGARADGLGLRSVSAGAVLLPAGSRFHESEAILVL